MGVGPTFVLGFGLTLASSTTPEETASLWANDPATGVNGSQAAKSKPSVRMPSANRHERARALDRWYGWQTWMADTTLAIFVAVGWDDDAKHTAPIAALGYLFLAPTVHWAHGNVGRGFISLGIRVVTPFVFGWLTKDTRTNGDMEWLIAALTVPTIMDATLLAYDDLEPDTEQSVLRAVPWFLPKRGSAGLSLIGDF